MNYRVAIAFVLASCVYGHAHGQTGKVQWSLRSGGQQLSTWDTKAKCDAAAKARNISTTYECPRLLLVTAKELPPVVIPPPVTPPASSPTPMPANPFVYINPDQAKWPKFKQSPAGGWDKAMLIPTDEKPTPNDIGAFRTACQAVKFGFFDPIVYPGKPNISHLHTFLGAYGINEASNGASLLAAGNSGCRGGRSNSSSYWFPSMIDTATGLPIPPTLESDIYYKAGYAVSSKSIKPLPVGLRLIAGDASGNPSKPSAAVGYSCMGASTTGWMKSIPDCKAPGLLTMEIIFPQCWDGKSLDSPDHKSHMTNPIAGPGNDWGNGKQVCPASHPVAVPQIAYQIRYDVKVSGETKKWRLASDNYDASQPAGYSGHADYIMAWDVEVMNTWVTKCLNAVVDCHSHLLGDGRSLLIP